MRKTDAATGLANSTRNSCSKSRPMIPTGTVAITINQARRSVSVSMRRRSRLRKSDEMILAHSLR